MENAIRQVLISVFASLVAMFAYDYLRREIVKGNISVIRGGKA